MAFKIEVSEKAERDIDEVVSFISEDSRARAKKWAASLILLLESLQEMPTRHALIAEATELGRPLRSIIYHSHRIIYEVQEAENKVYIVRVYHGARKPLTQEDIP